MRKGETGGIKILDDNGNSKEGRNVRQVGVHEREWPVDWKAKTRTPSWKDSPPGEIMVGTDAFVGKSDGGKDLCALLAVRMKEAGGGMTCLWQFNDRWDELRQTSDCSTNKQNHFEIENEQNCKMKGHVSNDRSEGVGDLVVVAVGGEDEVGGEEGAGAADPRAAMDHRRGAVARGHRQQPRHHVEQQVAAGPGAAGGVTPPPK